MIETSEGISSAPRMMVGVAWVMILVMGSLGACLAVTEGANQATPSSQNLIVPGDDSTRAAQENERSTPTTSDPTRQATIPPIDAAAPTTTHTATFALG